MSAFSEPPTAEDFRLAYASAALVINRDQAEAIAALVWEGKQRGTRYPPVEPPRAVALVATGPREGDSVPEHVQDRVTREYAADPYPDHRGTMMIRQEEPLPASHGVWAIAPDGRLWNIARMGICWPTPLPDVPEEEMLDGSGGPEIFTEDDIRAALGDDVDFVKLRQARLERVSGR